MEDPIPHTRYGRYSPSASSSSPTEAGSPTSFHKSLPIPPTSDLNDSSKMLLFTMFQLLKRIESQVEHQESRLKGVESTMSLRTQFQESQLQSRNDMWGHVVEEYERSILNLRENFAQGDEKNKIKENTEGQGRSTSDHSGVACQDEDACSVSVYSGNIPVRTLEQRNEEQPGEHLQSIRYETVIISNTGSSTLNKTQIPWEQPTSSPSRTLTQLSHRYVEVASEMLGTWKVSLISEYKTMKQDIRKYSTIRNSETTDAEGEEATNQRPPRPLYKLVGKTYCILDNGSTKLAVTIKKEWRIQKENRIATAKRFGHFSKANFKHVNQTLGALKAGFVAY